MNNNTNTQQGERLSFYKLFKEKYYRVLIPIIQRDYAQGRQTTTEIRDLFLEALDNYLKANIPNRDLDFVYGSLKEPDKITDFAYKSLNEPDKFTDFIPLDGQQRLTTLFLLHWYLYQISENTEKKAEFKGSLLKNGKSMFTYKTRSSSTEFCDALMSNVIDFNNLLKVDKDSDENIKEKSLSEIIEDSAWFFLSWKYDPTIKSMLIMLDAIHKRFAKKKEYFERLIDIEKPIITFLFLNLEDFKLTDDLYIKMNSRGKQLSSFENFKAKFEQHLENITPDTKERKFCLNFDGKDKKVSLKEYFSHNIDTKWANLFWNYKDFVEDKKDEDKKTYDDELRNFIRVIFTNQYAANVKITTEGSTEKTDDNFEYLLGTDPARNKEGYTDKISFFKYENLKALSSEGIFYLIDAFDALKIKNDKLKNHLSPSYKFYFDEEKSFINALKHDFSIFSERIMLHAYIRFLIQNEGNATGLDQWMRIIHNLSYNTAIDSAVAVARAIKSIEKMLPNSNDILTYLKNNDVDFFSSWQTLEEKIKTHLIKKGDNWKNKIENTEKNKCFDGQIGFILEFSGIVDYYDKNHNCDWTENENIIYLNFFDNYAEKATPVFRDKDNYNKDYVWERAVLTKEDYLIGTNPWRRNLLSKNTENYNWKRFLRITKEHEQKRQFVKDVFDDISFDVNNLQNSLEKICEHKTNTWRDYIIDCPDLIKYCKQGYIQIINENDIILLGQSQMNHYHSEMYTHFLWYKFFEKNQDSFKPFKPEYCYIIGSGKAHIVLKDFCHNNINYEIYIYYNYDDKSPNSYIIIFNIKDKNESDDYGDDIKDILSKLNFEWNETEKNYSFKCENSDALMKKLEEISHLAKTLQKADNTNNLCS